MKKPLITTLVSVPLLALSSMTFAAEPAAAEPMLLSASQMDSVTAGFVFVFERADVTQVNAFSPVTTAQISLVNVSAGGGANTALISSGNTSSISQ